jgi:hypothetical protein
MNRPTAQIEQLRQALIDGALPKADREISRAMVEFADAESRGDLPAMLEAAKKLGLEPWLEN